MKALPLALLPLLAGCQQPDLVAECARLEADSKAVVERHAKPPFVLDPVEERRFYLEERGNIDFPLLEVANPYAQRLKTRDPYTFCEAVMGRRAIPPAVPSPFR